MKHPQIILVTGASSGFGRVIATQLAAQGHIVYGSSRKQYPITPASKCCNWILLILHQYPMPYRQF